MRGVTTDSAGNVYVADGGNATIRKITPDGVVTTLAGMAEMIGSADGTGAAARFGAPEGVVTDAAGDVYVADNYYDTIRKITSDGVVTTIVGRPGETGFLAGPAPGLPDRSNLSDALWNDPLHDNKQRNCAGRQRSVRVVSEREALT